MGKLAYRRIASLAFPPGSIVEIGSERGEGSTAFLATLACERKVRFFSVDVEEQAYERARKLDGVEAWHTTGENFFSNCYDVSFGPLVVAYLDGYDWLYRNMQPDEVNRQIATYAQLGLELTHEKAQRSNLSQFIRLFPYTIPGSLVVIDDTWYDAEGWTGKGAWALERAIKTYDFKLIEFAEDPDNGGYVILRKEKI